MKFQSELEEFLKNHKFSTADVEGYTFHYLLCGKEDSPYTLTYFVGGTGNPRGWYRHVLAMEKDFRILLVDYPMGADEMDLVIRILGGLLDRLQIQKAVWIGASLGGYIAQLMARAYPDKTQAMVLYATTSLTRKGITDLKKQYRSIGFLLWLIEHVPYGVLKMLIMKPMMGKFIPKGDPEKEAYIKDFIQWIYDGYEKEQDLHMTRLMADMVNLKPMVREDLAYLGRRVLLILPENDKAFTVEMQNDLTEFLAGAKVEPMEGGHLSTLCDADRYAELTLRFLKTI